jgi:cytochrome o ubiquinol oxidase operon protein cyoD
VIYPHGVPILLGVLAIAQMGIHLVFFLHISSSPDQTNNILALVFGIFVVGLLVFAASPHWGMGLPDTLGQSAR